MEETIKTLLEICPEGKLSLDIKNRPQAVYDVDGKCVSLDGPSEFEAWWHFFPGRTQDGNKIEYVDLGKSPFDIEPMLKGILEVVQRDESQWDS